MKTKVLHLIHHLKVGGAETLVKDYALSIDKDKFEFIIVTLDGKKGTIYEEILSEHGIRVIFIGDKVLFPNTNNLLKKFINKVHRYLLFFRYVNYIKPNVIHAHLNVMKYLLPLNTKKLQVKLFYTIHSEVSRLFGKGKKFNTMITNYCIKRKGLIPIAIHSRMENEISNLFNTDKCIVINNAIDMSRFNQTKIDRVSVKKSLILNDATFIIGHVGRFDELKNHEFLIKVFDAVKGKCNNAHLILVGTGVLEIKIKEQVRKLGLLDNVSFLGSRQDIPELMSIMDIFLFPSISEGFGNVLIEAQAMGVKCVVSDKVPKDTFITDLVIPVGLEEPIEIWRDAILNQNNIKRKIDSFEKYDMKNIIKDLEGIYVLEEQNK